MSRLLKNTFIFTLGNLIPKLAQFVLLPIYTIYLTPADYGITNSINVVTNILAILFTFSINRSVYRLYYDFKTEEEKKDYLGTINIGIIVISTIILGLLFLFSSFIEKIYSNISFYPFFAFGIIAAYLTIWENVPKIYFLVQEKAKVHVTLSFLQFIVNNLAILFFVVYMKEGAVGYLKGTMFGALITVPVFLFIIFRTTNFKFNSTVFFDSLKFSLPLIPAQLSTWVYNLSDRIFIERYFSLTDVGIYSLGYKIAGLVLLFTASFKSSYDPFFYRIANTEKYEIAREKISKTNTIYYQITVFLSFTLAFFSEEIIKIFFNKEYVNAYLFIPILCLAYIFDKISGLINLSFYQNKNTKIVMIITLAGALVNLLFNFILIPSFGAFGAAWATVLTMLVLTIVKYFWSKKYYFIPVEWVKLSITTLALGAIFFVFTLFTLQNPLLTLFIKGIIYLIILSLIIFKFKEAIFTTIVPKNIYDKYFKKIIKISSKTNN